MTDFLSNLTSEDYLPIVDVSQGATGQGAVVKLGDLSAYVRGGSNLTNIMGRQITQKMATTTEGSDKTYHTTTTVEYAANRFRVALHNINASVSVITAGKMAVSNALGADPTYGATTGQARFTPSTGTWVNITWNGGATTVTLAGGAADLPSITWSDWIDISTIPRTDGGTLPVVMFRFSTLSGAVISYGNYDLTPWGRTANAFHNGRVWNSIRYTGSDGVSTPANFQPTTELGYPFMVGFEYNCVRPGLTIATNGDSITEGAVNGSTGNYGNGWNWQAIKILRARFPNTPIDLVNMAIAGTGTSNMLTRLKTFLNAGSHYSVMFHYAFSINDGTPDQSFINVAFSRLGQAQQLVAAQRKPFVTSTTCVNTALALTAPQDAFRLALRTELLSQAAGGLNVFDFESIADGATPARFVPAYTTDNTHPNEAGYAVLAPLAAAVFQQFLRS